ncbi:MAG: hypothetical protein HY748_06075 [Elusimicrobia bacterium]|nr:hypothetical protein [Elusimicrobiota bacterium]
MASTGKERVVGKGEVRHGALYRWVLNHDESWLFTVLYAGLSVALSLFISLFWLAVIVAAHGALEWCRQREISSERVLPRVLWEVKLDLALVAFSLVLAVYLDFMVGIAGLGQAARAGGRIGVRLADWQRILRSSLLSLDDVGRVLAAFFRGDRQVPAAGGNAGSRGGWGGRWSFGDRLSVGLDHRKASLPIGDTQREPVTAP